MKTFILEWLKTITPKTLCKFTRLNSKTNSNPKIKGNPVEVFTKFLKLGLTSFGGPVAHLGYFRKEFVERLGWISESQYSQLLAISQFLPGPASSQLGFALGHLRAGWMGATAAFIAFTLPSTILLVCFASLLPFFSGPFGIAVTNGLKIVAFAVVADAIFGMSKKLCPDNLRKSIALLVAVGLILFVSAWIQIMVIFLSALAGYFFCRITPSDEEVVIQLNYGKKLGFYIFGIFLLLLIISLFAPLQSGIFTIAEIFYRAGALVFGGGHVVLPLLKDSVVSAGHISNEAFLFGYGASQAIPGPMFSFSAYLGTLIPPENDRLLNASVALFFMFLPGFLLISAVLPFWQDISQTPQAINAISGVNAAVVGLLGASLYDPIFKSGINSEIDLAIGLAAVGMLSIFKLSTLYIVFWCVAACISRIMFF